MKVQIQRYPLGRVRAEIEVDAEDRLVFVDDGQDSPTILLRFLCAGGWYYQGLSWHCRAGRAKYLPALKQLYRTLRKSDLTNQTLRYLAWGEDRLRNNGYAIGTAAYAAYKARRSASARTCAGAA